MNNFTFLKKFSLLALFTLVFGGLQAQSTSPGIEVIDMTSCPGNTIEIDVMAMNWDSVVSMQFVTFFDPVVLSFTGASTSLPVFSQMQFGSNGAPTGYISTSWYDPDLKGISIHNEIAFTMTFHVIGEIGDCATITFGGQQPTIVEFTQAIDGNVTEFDPDFITGEVCLEVPEMNTIMSENEENSNGAGTLSLTVTGGTSPYNYAWNNGDTTPNITSLSEGDYSCDVTDASGCSSNLGPYSIENDITMSVNTIAGLNTFNLTPNPATDFVNLSVDFEQAEAATIKVYSLAGKVLYTHDVNTQAFNLEIPLNDLTNGAYFVEMTTKSGKAVEKLMVAK